MAKKRGGAPGEPATTPHPDDDLRRRLVALLIEHHGNVAEVARAMGKARMQIQRWSKRFGIELDAFRQQRGSS